jgi:hypothetical protein
VALGLGLVVAAVVELALRRVALERLQRPPLLLPRRNSRAITPRLPPVDAAAQPLAVAPVEQRRLRVARRPLPRAAPPAIAEAVVTALQRRPQPQSLRKLP